MMLKICESLIQVGKRQVKMVKNYEDNIISKYYNAIIHFKSAQSYLHDINRLSNEIDHFKEQSAKKVLSEIVDKYYSQVNLMGELLASPTAVKGTATYKQKNHMDLIHDMFYMLRLIIVFAAVKIGIEPNLKSAADKIKNENLNLFSLNIFE